MRYILLIFLAFGWPTLIVAQKKKNEAASNKDYWASISVHLDSAWTNDTVTVRIYDNIYVSGGHPAIDDIGLYTDYFSRNTNGNFSIQVPIQNVSFAYIYLRNADRKSPFPVNLLPWVSRGRENYFLLEKGDKISIHIKSLRPYPIATSKESFNYFVESDLKMSGRGSGELIYLQMIDQMLKEVQGKARPSNLTTKNIEKWPSIVLAEDSVFQNVSKQQLHLLDSLRGYMSAMDYQWLSHETRYHRKFLILQKAHVAIRTLEDYKKRNLTSEPLVKEVKSWYQDFINKKISSDTLYDPSLFLHYSNSYRAYYLSKLKLLKKFDPELSIYHQIKNDYSNDFRDYLITCYFNEELENDGLDSLFDEAVNLVVNRDYKKVLISAINHRGLNKPAYPFRLLSENGTFISLDDFKGKIVVLDFWYTGCGGCADLYKKVISRLEENFSQNPNLFFVTIAIDADTAIWRKSIKLNRYTTSGKSNVINLFSKRNPDDPLYKVYNLHTVPKPYLINTKGLVILNDLKYFIEYESIKKRLQEELDQIGRR